MGARDDMVDEDPEAVRGDGGDHRSGRRTPSRRPARDDPPGRRAGPGAAPRTGPPSEPTGALPGAVSAGGGPDRVVDLDRFRDLSFPNLMSAGLTLDPTAAEEPGEPAGEPGEAEDPADPGERR